MSNVSLRGQLKKSLGEVVRVHPEGDYLNSVLGKLKREDGGNGINTGWYVGGVQIPIGEIESAMPSKGVFDMGINPEYFTSKLNEWYFRYGA